MAIVAMKHLSLYAMTRDRDVLLKKLQRLGCVELCQDPDRRADPQWLALVRPDLPDREALQERRSTVGGALTALERYAPGKSGFLQPLPQTTLKDLFDDTRAERALEQAKAIRARETEIAGLDSQITKLTAQTTSLAPWCSLDLPLSFSGTARVTGSFVTFPATVDLAEARTALSEKAQASALIEAGTDRDLHYLLLLAHRSQAEEALGALKEFGISQVRFSGLSGTAAQETARLQTELSDLQTQRQSALEALTALAEARADLKLYADRLDQELSREAARSCLWTTASTFWLEGWVPEEDASGLETLLSGFDCAWELRDPEPEEYERVPVKLKNNLFTRCMNVVTEMYSLPAYGTVDPNPLMAPFFILFFGIMMADMGYGLLMIIAGAWVLKKARPRETMRNFMELVFWCGISTFVVGALTGGFFGDFIPQLCKLIDSDNTFELPALFTPLDDTIAIMLGSLVLGLIQIFTGMTVSIVQKCKAGNFIDALFDEITWWIILAGVALLALGLGNVAGVPAVLVVGCAMLVFGGTRQAHGFGKVTKLVGLVYNGVTGYFSDILSYVRLMALMLSGSVIAQVFNTLGAAFGSVVPFILISMVGNALNLALNLLGCYVHDLRLQCLEFFNRFYCEGGAPFAPLSIQTNSVDIIEEET